MPPILSSLPLTPSLLGASWGLCDLVPGGLPFVRVVGGLWSSRLVMPGSVRFDKVSGFMQVEGEAGSRLSTPNRIPVAPSGAV